MDEEREEEKTQEEKTGEKIKKTVGWISILRAAGEIFVPPFGFLAGLAELNFFHLFRKGTTSAQRYFILLIDGVFAMGIMLIIILFFFLFCEIPGTGWVVESCDLFDANESFFAGVPSSSPFSGSSQSSQIAGDKCEPCDSGFATPENLENTIATNSILQTNCGSNFDPTIASRVASAESACNSYQSTIAKCGSDGTEFAIGLFQINMTVHEIYDAEGKPVTMKDKDDKEYHCKDVFSGRNLDCRKKTGSFYDELYKKCYDTLRTGKDAPLANLVNACKIQKAEGWNAWVAYSDYKDCRDPNMTS